MVFIGTVKLNGFRQVAMSTRDNFKPCNGRWLGRTRLLKDLKKAPCLLRLVATLLLTGCLESSKHPPVDLNMPPCQSQCHLTTCPSLPLCRDPLFRCLQNQSSKNRVSRIQRDGIPRMRSLTTISKRLSLTLCSLTVLTAHNAWQRRLSSNFT